MSLTIGIVGLPNVGKSTLFNALTRNNALAANYPFATIDPNVGVVPLKDERLSKLAKVVGTQTLVPATVKFVDIAGIVKGAYKGEGLGNQFLSHIREADAICEVVRVFKDDDIVHVENRVDPKSDIETINTELILSDMQVWLRRKRKQIDPGCVHSLITFIVRLFFSEWRRKRSLIPGLKHFSCWSSIFKRLTMVPDNWFFLMSFPGLIRHVQGS